MCVPVLLPLVGPHLEEAQGSRAILPLTLVVLMQVLEEPEPGTRPISHTTP